MVLFTLKATLVLNYQRSVDVKILRKNINLVMQEILKMFMSQISLKKLSYIFEDLNMNKNLTFVHFPGARDCLTNLSELTCNSNVQPEIFYQLSQICHNIQSLNIKFNNYANEAVLNRLKDLISSQNNLKSLSLAYYGETNYWAEIIPSLKNHSDTLIKLNIKGEDNHWPLTFIKDFKNLKELDLSFNYINIFESFGHLDDLQHFIFPHLKILNINFPTKVEDKVKKFLENNGKNLEELQISKNASLNLVIIRYCPKLKSLHTIIAFGLSLKFIFKECKKLESIEILRRGTYLSGKKLLEIVAKHSPKNFHELKLHDYYAELDSEDLESFFIEWKNRNPRKLLTLIFEDICYKNDENNDNKNKKNYGNEEVIEKYEKLGVVNVLKM